MKRLRAMKRSTFFALLAVLLIVITPLVVYATVTHPGTTDTITIGSIGKIIGSVPTNGNTIVITEANEVRIEGKLLGGKRAAVAAHHGGTASLRADSGAELWVVGSGNSNNGDVIVVLKD